MGEEIAIALSTTPAGDVVLTGTTTSSDFPTTSGAYDRTLGGGQDIFITSFDKLLTRLNWSTLLGSQTRNQDNVLGLTVAPNGDVLLCGSTIGADFPTTAGAARTTSNALSEGFITRLRNDGQALQASTFFGAAASTNQVVKVLLNKSGRVYIAGNTADNRGIGVLASTPGTVSVPEGVWFVGSLTPSLGAVEMITTPASAIHPLNITAFGLDQCGNVQIAGSVPAPNNAGMPTVNPLPNGKSGGLYVMTLNPSATAILFATYFGPSYFLHSHSTSNYFDSAGVLYQALCSFTQVATSAGAYEPVARNLAAYELAALKLDAGVQSENTVQAAVAPPDSVCAPAPVTFTNKTIGSRRFIWNFADGSPADTTQNPVHVFLNSGTYRVRLVALGTDAECSKNDTTYVTVRVKAKPVVALPKNLILCTGNTLTLRADSPGNTYRWSTGATTTSISITQAGKYSVIVSNGRCSTRDSTVVRQAAEPTLTSDTTGCIAGGIRLRTTAEPGSTYVWSTQETTASIMASTSGRYTVRITQGGCVSEKSVNVMLLRPVLPPNIITPNGDGKNDVFMPSETATVEPGTSLRIYNRWGKEVYTSDNYKNDWAAIGQPAGIYYYTLENGRFCTPRVKGWLEVVK